MSAAQSTWQLVADAFYSSVSLALLFNERSGDQNGMKILYIDLSRHICLLQLQHLSFWEENGNKALLHSAAASLTTTQMWFAIFVSYYFLPWVFSEVFQVLFHLRSSQVQSCFEIPPTSIVQVVVDTQPFRLVTVWSYGPGKRALWPFPPTYNHCSGHVIQIRMPGNRLVEKQGSKNNNKGSVLVIALGRMLPDWYLFHPRSRSSILVWDEADWSRLSLSHRFISGSKTTSGTCTAGIRNLGGFTTSCKWGITKYEALTSHPKKLLETR